MKILEYSTNKFEELELNGNTAMLMCFQPKIVLFETSDEMWVFKTVWESIIEKYLDEHEELDEDYELRGTATWFVDPFEGEWYPKSLIEQGKETEYGPRKIRMISDAESDDSDYEDEYNIIFGIINSQDMYIGMDTLENHIKSVKLMFSTEEMWGRLKEETKKMFEDILEVWEEEIRLYNTGNAKYFKVTVKEEN